MLLSSKVPYCPADKPAGELYRWDSSLDHPYRRLRPVDRLFEARLEEFDSHLKPQANTRFGEEHAPPDSAAARDASCLTYESFYGLREKPFSLSADPKFFFRSPSHISAHDALLTAIRRREGIVVLTGEVGTGKTTLCRAALNGLGRKTFTAFVPDPFLSREDLLKTLLVEFGVVSIEDAKHGRLRGASRTDLSFTLYDFLKTLIPLRAFAVLIIDEAQNLPSVLLEEIRILADLDQPDKLLQVVLVGQPELQAQIRLPHMRQLDQRVTARCDLQPLTRDAIGPYVAHRLAVAGNAQTIEFSLDALEVLHHVSGGVPRVINLICDRTMTLAWRDETWTVTPRLVLGAARDIDLPPRTALPVFSAKRPQAAETRDANEPKAAPAAEPGHAPADAARQPAPPFSDDRGAGTASGGTSENTEHDEAEARVFQPILAAPPTYLRRRRRRHRQRLLATVTAAAVVSTAVLATPALVSWAIAQLAPESTATPAAPEPPMLPRGTALLVAEPPVSEELVIEAERQADAGATSESADRQQYVIQVASLDSQERAASLVTDLAAQGYRAYQVDLDLGERGRLYLVRVGRYSNLAAARDDHARISRMAGYADAKLVPVSRSVRALPASGGSGPQSSAGAR